MKLPPTIAANIDQFTGRTWLLPKVVDWYERNDERILLICGGPGTGKSMIMAWLAGHGPVPNDTAAREQLAQIRTEVKAAHFCVAASGETAPRALAQNLAEQLTRNVPGYADALAASLAELVTITPIQKVEKMERGASLTGVQIGSLNLAGLGEELSFNRALREPLKKLYENGYEEPLLLLVDALDEALTYTGVIDIVQLLAKLVDLPEQVRFLVTTRPDPRVLKHFRQARRVDLIEDAPPDVDDVQAYASGRLARLEGLSAAKIEAFASRIAKAAGGIFLYAAIVLEELRPRLPSLPDLDRYPLPDGLSGLYYDFLNRELGRNEDRWYERFRPVLGLIAVAQGNGLTARQLGAITGREVEQTLRICRQYLSGEWPGGPFRCFHRSFVEWLLEDEENVDYHIDGAQMHRRIADHYWEAHHPDWRSCDAYGLDSLATHLHYGGQDDRLQKLISQQWMAARFEGSGYAYESFLGDLMLAWQGAHKAALRQIKADQAPAALADCVYYALIRTSLNSLAANYDPVLVACAVDTGLWPAERALNVAGRVPSPEGRVRMLVALLATSRLGPELTTKAQEAGLAAALAMPNEVTQAWALAKLAPQLRGEALARGLDAALALGDVPGRVWALAALTPHLTGEALAALTPQLTGGALVRGLEAALTIEDAGATVEVMTALAPQLTGEALARGLEAVLTIGDEALRAVALAALAPQLTGEALARGLEAALAMEDEGSRAWVLAALAPQLTGQARTQALVQGLEAALAIGGEDVQSVMLAVLATRDEGSRAWALAGLAPHVRGEVLAQALKVTLTLEETWARAEVLALLVPQLAGETLARGLQAALAIGDEWYRAQALAALAPQLTGEALARGLGAALAIMDEEDQAKVLAALAPQLTGEARELALVRELDLALGIRSEEHRVAALAALAPQLTGEAREQALVRGLDTALGIEDEYWRADALAALAPKLTGKARIQALARGLEAAMAISDTRWRAKALAALAPRLTGEAQTKALTQGLAAALAIGNKEAQAEALMALAPQLTGEERTQALEAGLAAALAIEYERDRAWALAALAPQLTDEARAQALAHGLDAALTIEDGWDRVWALAALAPQFGDQGRARVVVQALAAALTMGEVPRARALAGLASLLTGQALAQALDAALAIQDEEWRAHALAGLAPKLTGEGLARGLRAAEAIGGERDRLKALAAFLPVAPDRAALLRGVRQAMADHLLKNLSVVERKKVLWFCTDQTLFAPPILDQDTLAAIAGHVVEVCWEWKWM